MYRDLVVKSRFVRVYGGGGLLRHSFSFKDLATCFSGSSGKVERQVGHGISRIGRSLGALSRHAFTTPSKQSLQNEWQQGRVLGSFNTSRHTVHSRFSSVWLIRCGTKARAI